MPPTYQLKIIIPAGGVGARMGLAYPKQLLPFGKSTVLAHTVDLFRPHLTIVAVPPDHRRLFEAALPRDTLVVDGGATRFDSVRLAFAAFGTIFAPIKDDDLVVIHDAARPFFDPSWLGPACDLAFEKGAVVFASRATDTVKLVGEDGVIVKTLDRDKIYLAQTPQIFKAGLLREAYAKVHLNERPTDEAALMEQLGIPVQIFASGPTNKKVTTAEDLPLLESGSLRIGHGYDVHRFDASRPLYLGGIAIPESPGLLGHSDADVLLHALMDALLGAAGLGDIGQWFPDSDPKLKGIRSTLLLNRVMAALAEHGYGLENADMTVMAQVPKLAPHIAKMRAALAARLGVAENRINIKATTTEGLGFVGRKEGIAAQAVVLLTRRHGS